MASVDGADSAGGVLQAGDKVEYRVAVFNERPRAKDVRVLKRA